MIALAKTIRQWIASLALILEGAILQDKEYPFEVCIAHAETTQGRPGPGLYGRRHEAHETVDRGTHILSPLTTTRDERHKASNQAPDYWTMIEAIQDRGIVVTANWLLYSRCYRGARTQSMS